MCISLSDKGFILCIQKEVSKYKCKKPIYTWAKRLNTFHKREYADENNNIKTSTPSVLREENIIALRRHCHTPTEVAEIKTERNKKGWWGHGAAGPLIPCGRES